MGLDRKIGDLPVEANQQAERSTRFATAWSGLSHMTELSRTLMRSWPRTISQQVVPADAGTHNGLRSEKRPLLKCRSESPRRMGPCVRRDDSLENSICDSLAHKGEGIDRMRGQVSGAISALLTPPKFVIRYNYSRQDVISPWETPDPPRP